MKKTGISKGFGFVCFNNEADAEKALAGIRLKSIGKKNLYLLHVLKEKKIEEFY